MNGTLHSYTVYQVSLQNTQISATTTMNGTLHSYTVYQVSFGRFSHGDYLRDFLRHATSENSNHLVTVQTLGTSINELKLQSDDAT